MHRIRQRTRTERLMAFLDGVALALTVLAVAVTLRGTDAMYIQILTGLWIAEAAHFHQLYAKKESRANSQKYMQKWVDDYAEKYGPETAARFAEIVLQNSNT